MRFQPSFTVTFTINPLSEIFDVIAKKENAKQGISHKEDKEELIGLLKEKGLWDEISMINFMKLQSKVIKDEVDEDIKEEVEIGKDFRLSLSKRKDVEED